MTSAITYGGAVRHSLTYWIGGSLALPINGASLPGLLLLACFCGCLDWCCVHGEHASSVRCDHGDIVAGVDDHVVNKRDR